MKLKSFGLALGLVAVIVTSANAVAAGDAEAGALKVMVCVSCHGQGGLSVNPDFPSLAGQVPGYIASQLANYKNGVRQNAIMTGMVAALTDEDMANIDAYFSSQPPAIQYISEEEAVAAERGGKIYRGGYRPFSIAACMGCHGPGGHGIPPTYPRLSGQYAKYLEQQLLAFKSGARSHDIMNPIAFKLSEAQIKDLALYMSALN